MHEAVDKLVYDLDMPQLVCFLRSAVYRVLVADATPTPHSCVHLKQLKTIKAVYRLHATEAEGDVALQDIALTFGHNLFLMIHHVWPSGRAIGAGWAGDWGGLGGRMSGGRMLGHVHVLTREGWLDRPRAMTVAAVAVERERGQGAPQRGGCGACLLRGSHWVRRGCQ